MRNFKNCFTWTEGLHTTYFPEKYWYIISIFTIYRKLQENVKQNTAFIYLGEMNKRGKVGIKKTKGTTSGN